MPGGERTRPMQDDKRPLLLLCLSSMGFLSFKEKVAVQNNLDSADDLALLSVDDLTRMVGRTIRAQWRAKDCVREAEKAERILRAFRIGMILHDDAAYPALLRETVNPPFALFCRGDATCLSGRTVSVVGTRRMSPVGKRAAVSFARDAADDGVTVVSGLAYGIDGAAHTGAVEACFDAMEAGRTCGKTVAVLPCGCDMIAPSGHKRLAEKIIDAGGCLVSEYVPGTPSEAWRFAHRNRIIAALSPALLVVEAPPGSGALITAQLAVDYNRDLVFHAAAFSAQAREVAANVRTRLEKDFAAGKVKKGKIENTAERYVSEGAPVVKNYADFRLCLAERPGVRAETDGEQIPLF